MLAQTDQDRWTFAQALPIVLVILAAFYAADVWKGTFLSSSPSFSSSVSICLGEDLDLEIRESMSNFDV